MRRIKNQIYRQLSLDIEVSVWEMVSWEMRGDVIDKVEIPATTVLDEVMSGV